MLFKRERYLIMDMNEYQEKAKSTAVYPRRFYQVEDSVLGIDTGIMYNALNLASEAGEVSGKIAKAIRKDEPVDFYIDDIVDEIGDTLYHVAMLAYELGYTLDYIAQRNVDKLADRMQRNVIIGEGDKR
jgi:NTP pyrophosphatase (non-canonical NTP hydrolase)